MLHEIRRQERAKADELDIWLHIAAENQTAADRTLDRIDETVRMLAQFPDAGRARPELSEGLRSYAVDAFTVYYHHDHETLRVVRILSGYRKITPGLFE